MIYKALTEGLFVLKIDQEKSFEYTEAKLEEREIERKESNQNSELHSTERNNQRRTIHES